MNIRNFLILVLRIFGVLATVNLPLNWAFERLKDLHYITQISEDGFSTWSLHFSPQKNMVENTPDPMFLGEVKTPEEISKFKNIIVILGSSVVAGDGVKKGERFSDELNKGAALVGKYFFNAGHSGSEAYTYFQKIPVLVNRYPQVRCVVWLPNRNDLISRREFKRRLDEKEAAKGLTSKESMPLQDLLFFGIYKRLGQRFTFEGNIQKEKALNSPHNMYYTQGLVEPLDSETQLDLEVTIKEAKVLLDSKNIHFSAVFLPTRHFNHYYTWNEAKSFQQLVGVLNRVGLNSFQFFDLIKGHDYYVDFVHFSPEGHRALANMLEERLNELCPEE